MRVATKRLQEARTIHVADNDSVGSAYMAGYGVECAIKAYLAKQGKRVPSHDLVVLIRSAGLPLSIFKEGCWFLSAWTVDWRYLQQATQISYTPEECISAAGFLQGFISKQLARATAKRVRRGK